MNCLSTGSFEELSFRARPPNPRVQRTRPYASLQGSPLTRHPLGQSLKGTSRPSEEQFK
jgi:hypothetical protein